MRRDVCENRAVDVDAPREENAALRELLTSTAHELGNTATVAGHWLRGMPAEKRRDAALESIARIEKWHARLIGALRSETPMRPVVRCCGGVAWCDDGPSDATSGECAIMTRRCAS